MGNKLFQVKLADEIISKVKGESQRLGISSADIIRMAIVTYFERDIYGKMD